MKKLKLEELNRDSLSEYRSKEKIDLVIVLDNLRSGMNVGSVFRTADCFGIKKLVLCGITPIPPHKEIFKTAIGAQDSVDWNHIEDSTKAISKLKDDGYYIIGVEQTDESISLSNINLTNLSKIALVMGNEVNGLSDELLPQLDIAMDIKQFGTKHSLNVSVCAGVVMWEIARKMRQV